MTFSYSDVGLIIGVTAFLYVVVMIFLIVKRIRRHV